MAATPTKGPWETDPLKIGTAHNVGTEATDVCLVSAQVGDTLEGQEVRKANAALIVAACNACMTVNPENPIAVAEMIVQLIEAANVAESFLRHLTPQAQGQAGQQAELLLRAALARIEGKG